jgi:thioredoxin-related protein
MSNTFLYVIVIIVLLYILNRRKRCKSDGFGRTKDTEIIAVYWFHRPGCPHCDNMKDDWTKLTKIGLPAKYKLIAVDTSVAKNKELADKHGVSGVPHITKIGHDGYIKVYNGDRSVSHMKHWILNE